MSKKTKKKILTSTEVQGIADTIEDFQRIFEFDDHEGNLAVVIGDLPIYTADGSRKLGKISTKNDEFVFVIK